MKQHIDVSKLNIRFWQIETYHKLSAQVSPVNFCCRFEWPIVLK